MRASRDGAAESRALERGEDDAAFAWLVAVLEEVAGHGLTLPQRHLTDIGAPP